MTRARDPISALVPGAPLTISEKLTLRQLAAVLTTQAVGAALVDRPDGSIGIVTERDVTRALAEDADPDVVWSADVMTERLVTAHADAPIADVALRLTEVGIRHIAVMEEERVVGLVSSRDVLQVLAEDAFAS